jgi:formate dehydrogenase subunit gamma
MMPAMRMPPGREVVPRYSTGERLTHWAVAVAYVALFLSGLALFHPFFYWTSALFGGAAFMRVLHPFLGVALFVLFYAYALRLWRDNILTDSDTKWMSNMVAYMNRAAEPYVDGKYNAGQKLMYWSMIVSVAALLVTGIFLWRPYFAPAFSLPVRRFMAVFHAIFAFIMFVGIGIHVYAGYWTKGSFRAMTRGTVTRAWARLHYPGWYRQMTGKEP